MPKCGDEKDTKTPSLLLSLSPKSSRQALISSPPREKPMKLMVSNLTSECSTNLTTSSATFFPNYSMDLSISVVIDSTIKMEVFLLYLLR